MILALQHAAGELVWQFDIRHAAEGASHAMVLLSAFALTIIVLLVGSSDLREDPLSSFVIRPFLVAFIGNLLAAFMLLQVASDHALSERTFAMIIPPQLMSMTATALMIFGIMLAVMRQFPDQVVARQALWLFGFFGLFSVGLLHTGLSDLLHVHHDHERIAGHLALETLVLVWSPALLALLIPRALRGAHQPGDLSEDEFYHRVQRLHNANLWLSAGALMVATAIFAASVLLWAPEAVHLAEAGEAAAELESHVESIGGGYLVEVIAVFTATIQWLVLGSCFYLLRRFDRLTARFPRPPSRGGHDHPPHPPM